MENLTLTGHIERKNKTLRTKLLLMAIHRKEVKLKIQKMLKSMNIKRLWRPIIAYVPNGNVGEM